MSGPMDAERLADVKALAAASVLAEKGPWRAHAFPGHVNVSVFVDGAHAETLATCATTRIRADMIAFDGRDLSEVLAHADHWEAEATGWRRHQAEARSDANNATGRAVKAEAEAKRWRSECPVTAAHVEAAGVTSGKAWLWQQANRPGCRPQALATWMAVAMAVNHWAKAVCRPAHDILDEMAALTVADGDAP